MEFSEIIFAIYTHTRRMRTELPKTVSIIIKCWSIQWKQKGQLGQSIETTQMEIEQKAHPANDAGYTKWFFNIKNSSRNRSIVTTNEMTLKLRWIIAFFFSFQTTKIYDAKITIWNRPLWFKRMTDFDIYFKWETSGLKCEWLCSISSSNRTYVFL